MISSCPRASWDDGHWIRDSWRSYSPKIGRLCFKGTPTRTSQHSERARSAGHTGLKWEHLASTQPLTPGHLMGLTRAGYLGNLTFPASAETIDPRHIEDTDQDSDSLSLEIFRTKQTPSLLGVSLGLGFLYPGLVFW